MNCDQVVLGGDYSFQWKTNSADTLRFLSIVDLHGFSPLPDFFDRNQATIRVEFQTHFCF